MERTTINIVYTAMGNIDGDSFNLGVFSTLETAKDHVHGYNAALGEEEGTSEAKPLDWEHIEPDVWIANVWIAKWDGSEGEANYSIAVWALDDPAAPVFA